MTSNYCHLSTIFLTKKLQHPGLTFTAVQWASATPLGLVALGLSTTWCTGSSELYLGICNTWNTFSACNLVSEVLPVFVMVAEERLPLCWKSCKYIRCKMFPWTIRSSEGGWRLKKEYLAILQPRLRTTKYFAVQTNKSMMACFSKVPSGEGWESASYSL